MKIFYPALLVLLFHACGPNLENPQVIIDLANKSHGTKLFESKTVEFDFRDKHYSLDRTTPNYRYTREFPDSMGYVVDVLINSSHLSRTIDNISIELTEEWQGKYANSVNSVLYFFQLPYTLNDPAAQKTFEGVIEIKGEKYLAVKITFSQIDGGKDFEDEFMYWIHSEKMTIDFMAYNYITEGGGVRFREAFNQKRIQGLLIQDYINFMPEDKFTPLEDLPGLWENGELKELSRIENLSVIVK